MIKRLYLFLSLSLLLSQLFASNKKLFFGPCKTFSKNMKFDCYRDFKEMSQFLKDAQKKYPQFTKLESIGKSYEGRDLWLMTITDFKTGKPEDKPAIWIDGGVDSDEVINMNRRMMGQEKSLNSPIKAGETDEWQDWLVDESLDQELLLSQKQEFDDRKELLKNAMSILNKRETEILQARRLSENPKTLEELSAKFKISRERVRQIETKAFEKLQKSMINASKSNNLLPRN